VRNYGLSRLLVLLGFYCFSLPLMAASWASFAPVQEALQGIEPQTSGLQLDLPLVSEDGASVPLAVRFQGELVAEDQIKTLRVFATGNPNPEIIDFHFQDSRVLPDLATRVRLNESQTVIALAISESGQAWVTEREVRVTVSGCLMRSDEDAEAGMQNPRIALPRRMSAGQPAEIRTLINHPMETGLREDEQGNLLSQNLVESLTLQLDGKQAFKATFHTGTSANPYLRLQVKLPASAEAIFTWRDQQGQQVAEERSFNLR